VPLLVPQEHGQIVGRVQVTRNGGQNAPVQGFGGRPLALLLGLGGLGKPGAQGGVVRMGCLHEQSLSGSGPGAGDGLEPQVLDLAQEIMPFHPLLQGGPFPLRLIRMAGPFQNGLHPGLFLIGHPGHGGVVGPVGVDIRADDGQAQNAVFQNAQIAFGFVKGVLLQGSHRQVQIEAGQLGRVGLHPHDEIMEFGDIGADFVRAHAEKDPIHLAGRALHHIGNNGQIPFVLLGSGPAHPGLGAGALAALQGQPKFVPQGVGHQYPLVRELTHQIQQGLGADNDRVGQLEEFAQAIATIPGNALEIGIVPGHFRDQVVDHQIDAQIGEHFPVPFQPLLENGGISRLGHEHIRAQTFHFGKGEIAAIVIALGLDDGALYLGGFGQAPQGGAEPVFPHAPGGGQGQYPGPITTIGVPACYQFPFSPDW